MIETTLVGRVGRDAEMRYTPTGKAVTSVSVACDVGTKDNPKTVWVRCTLWEKAAESLTQYLLKGQQVVVFANISEEPRVYQAKDGTWKASLEMTSRRIKLVGGRPEQAAPAAAYNDDSLPDSLGDDLIPF